MPVHTMALSPSCNRLIEPLYKDCKSDHQMLAALMGEGDSSGLEIVQGYWEDQYSGERFRKILEEIAVRWLCSEKRSRTCIGLCELSSPCGFNAIGRIRTRNHVPPGPHHLGWTIR